VKPIEARPDEPRQRLDSDDLLRLARTLSGRIQVECGKCRNQRKLDVQTRELRLGSSPDLSEIDPNQPGRPRIIFYCIFCHRIIGFIQGDEWSEGAGDTDGDAPTRWDRLELEDARDDG
jgi:hypothetical protein